MWQCLRRVNSEPFVRLYAPFKGYEYLPIAFHTTCNSMGDLWGLWVYLDKMHEKLAVNAGKICDRFDTVIGNQWWWLLRERPQSWMAWTPWIYRTLTSQQVPSQPICVTTLLGTSPVEAAYYYGYILLVEQSCFGLDTIIQSYRLQSIWDFFISTIKFM